MSILDAGAKLIYHYDRVYDLCTTGYTNPVHITVGLTNYCNHRCVWCYIAFIRDESRKRINADIDKMLEAVKDAADMGVKAVTIVGDGEPTLHPEFERFVTAMKSLRLDIGIFTNGSWKKDVTKTLLENMTFVRFSIDSITPEMHMLLHKAEDYNAVISNLKKMLSDRYVNRPTIGIQFAINHINSSEAIAAAAYFREIGVDYISFKPVYRNDLNPLHEENRLNADNLRDILVEAKRYENGRFKVLWKEWQMDALIYNKNAERPYKQCLAVWLSPYIDEDGNVEFCGNLKGRGYSIGNVYHDKFRDIWNSKTHLHKLSEVDLGSCPQGCKLHSINLQLCDIMNPDRNIHQNFI